MDEYRNGCDEKWQTQSFSGVGDQNHNARADCAIQTTTYTARIFMFQTSLYWTDRGADDLSFWFF